MPNPEDSSLLIVTAHPDDECLGAGGTIALHTSRGNPVDLLCLTGNEIRNQELEAACAKLGIRRVYYSKRDDFDIDLSLTDEVVEAILTTRPKAIITHSYQDYNRNHSMCAKIVDEAVEWASHTTLHENAFKVSTLYHMEVNSLITQPTIMVNITDSYDTALDALKKHVSQVGKADGYYLKFYDARTMLRGIQADCPRAEAFTQISTKHVGPFYPENHVSSLI